MAVCFANVRMTTSRDSEKLHLQIILKRELPKGVTVGSYVQWLDNVPEGDLFVKVPQKYRPQVLLELPAGMTAELELAEGTVDLSSIKGSDINVNVAKGDVFLTSVTGDDFRTIKATFAIGGLKTTGAKERPDDSNMRWSKSGSSWNASGSGTHYLAVVIGFGHLYVLR